MIQKGPCHLLMSFGEGLLVVRFVASSHMESLTLKLGLLHFHLSYSEQKN
jgi:hypothetical protein